MDLDEELEAWMTLALAPGLSADAFRKLLVAFGGPQQVLRANRAALARVVPAEAADAALAPVPRELMQAVGAWLDDPLNRLLTYADSVYPQTLLQMPDPPPVLYVKGRVDLLNGRALAIVGSRNATRQGAEHAESFAHTVADAGFTIVSGLAQGIDAAAHRGGLKGKASTVAVAGTGLDTVYPARNHDLAHAIASQGCLISEFPLGTPPLPANFPRRNRIIAGLARGCLVVEAAVASGSLITARLANEQGKEVFAIPGSIHSPLSKGCHALIKQGAKLVETAQDILEELGMASGARTRRNDPSADADTDPLLDALGYDACDIDMLAARTGIPAQDIAARITEWEIDGVVEALPGGRYQRIR
ncbi:MAG TPA: DNA-processing protein DprA [Burkholderiales bacterium]|nr:DNA-processing protein DprA [Burkholderiales bacterium]